MTTVEGISEPERRLPPQAEVIAVAVCDPAVAACAERSLHAGEATWNAVKRRWLAEGGEIEAVDLEALPWIDVDTPADVRRAERLGLAARPLRPGQLRGLLQPSVPSSDPIRSAGEGDVPLPLRAPRPSS
jgi:hypothetical protein